MSRNPKWLAHEGRSRARRHGLNSFLFITKYEGSVWTSSHLPFGFESHMDNGASDEEWGTYVGLIMGGKTKAMNLISLFLFLSFIHPLLSNPSTVRFGHNNAKSMAFTTAR